MGVSVREWCEAGALRQTESVRYVTVSTGKAVRGNRMARATFRGAGQARGLDCAGCNAAAKRDPAGGRHGYTARPKASGGHAARVGCGSAPALFPNCEESRG